MTDLPAWWNRLTPSERNLLTILDEYLNEQTGGDPGTTLTYRFAKAQAAGQIDGIIACRILDRLDPGHCDRALQAGH